MSKFNSHRGKFNLPVKGATHWYDFAHNEIMGRPSNAQAISDVPDLAQNIDLTAGTTDPVTKLEAVTLIERNVASYNSVADSNILTDSPVTQPFEIFLFNRRGFMDAIGDANTGFDSGDVSFLIFRLVIPPYVFIADTQFNCGNTIRFTGFGDQRYFLHQFTGNGASSQIRRAGVLRVTGDAGTNDLGTPFKLGTNIADALGWGTPGGFNAQIGEVIIYDFLFNAQQIAHNEEYFRRKWGGIGE